MRPLRPEEVPAAAEALARSFDGDPMYRFLLPERRRLDWLRFLMRGALEVAMPDGHVFTVDGVPGAIGLLPPGRYPPPGRRLSTYFFRRGARPPMPFPGPRLLWRSNRVISVMERLHLADPHYYVQVVGVDPAHQGRGYGRALLEPAVGLADRDRVPGYLETTNEANLPLYRRFGFEVVEAVTLPGYPPLWTMRREPR